MFSCRWLDTLSIAKRFMEAGFPKKQAEAQASVIAEVVVNNLASKQDVQRLDTTIKQEVERLETTIKQEVERLETKIQNIEEKLEAKIALCSTREDLQAAKVDIMKWMFGGFVTLGVLLAGILVKLS